MTTIPDDFTDLLGGDAVATLTTLMPDGSPHSTPVWVDYDGEHVLVNTLEGRQKARNVRRDPRVSVCVTDPDDPYRYLSIRGEVVAVTAEGAVEHIDALAERYTGVDEYPGHDEEDGDRLVVAIRPERVMTAG